MVFMRFSSNPARVVGTVHDANREADIPAPPSVRARE
jgi:hypothetical protein